MNDDQLNGPRLMVSMTWEVEYNVREEGRVVPDPRLRIDVLVHSFVRVLAASL